MKLYDWHKMLADLKDATGGLPNYKRQVVWEYIKAKDERIAELEKDISDLADSNIKLREENRQLGSAAVFNAEGL
jgi:hypothetical protein